MTGRKEECNIGAGSALGYRPTVGHLTLDQVIGVRIPVPQSYDMVCRADRASFDFIKGVLFFVFSQVSWSGFLSRRHFS